MTEHCVPTEQTTSFSICPLRFHPQCQSKLQLGATACGNTTDLNHSVWHFLAGGIVFCHWGMPFISCVRLAAHHQAGCSERLQQDGTLHASSLATFVRGCSQLLSFDMERWGQRQNHHVWISHEERYLCCCQKSQRIISRQSLLLITEHWAALMDNLARFSDRSARESDVVGRVRSVSSACIFPSSRHRACAYYRPHHRCAIKTLSVSHRRQSSKDAG